MTATYPNNLLLSVSGTAEQVQSAFYVNLVYRYRSDGSTFVAVDREPSLDLAIPILRISGLGEAFVPRSAGQFGTGTNGFRAADLRNAYLGVNSSAQALDGTGQVVGILGSTRSSKATSPVITRFRCRRRASQRSKRRKSRSSTTPAAPAARRRPMSSSSSPWRPAPRSSFFMAAPG